MDKQLKKSHFYKFSLVCVCVFCFFFVFRKGAYVIFSICADKGFFCIGNREKRLGLVRKDICYKIYIINKYQYFF